MERKKKKHCWRLWPFSRDNHAWIPEYLEKMEKKGLRLDYLMEPLSIARYEKIAPQETRYDTSLFWSKDYYEISEYMEFCQESGWETVWQLQECKIFRAKDGANPLPLETDEEIQAEKQESITRKRRNGSAGLAIVYLVFVYLFYKICSPFDLLIMPWATQILPVIVAMLSVWYALQMCWCWKNWILTSICLKEGRCWRPGGDLRWIVPACLAWRWLNILFDMGVCIIGFLLVRENGFNSAVGILAGPLGGFIGSALRHHNIVKSTRKEGLQLKGMRLEKQSCIIWGILLCCIAVGMLWPVHPQEERITSNFYLSEIRYSKEYDGIPAYGDASFTARDSQVADRLYSLLDADIREPYAGMYLGSPEVWDEQTAAERGYVEYDQVYYYKNSCGRLLLRRGNTVLLTNWNIDK